VVDPRWLLKALGVTILAAVVCAYLATCLLIYQGSWQMILFPSKKIDATPTAAFQAVRFDAGETGTPRLTAWWIPAESPTRTTPTILYLHDRIGSLSTSVRQLDLLHRTDVNIFAIDYRGFGLSDPRHPTEPRMAEDSAAALEYLTETRHIPASTIVPYGVGVGAVLAANLAKSHSELPAVILDNPDPDVFENAFGSAKTRLLPMHLLAQERFDIAGALAGCSKPKLLLADSPFGGDKVRLDANHALFRSAPDPKMTVTFDHPGEDSEDAYVQSIRRFLDEYLPHS
jgi:pimeloyl-ACP methyl ester carboxylesterase